MEQLVIRLGSVPSDVIHWLVWSLQENEIIASGELHGIDELSSLTERAGQRPITALVPTSDVALKWVTLPAKAGRKAMNAIPFMLEDEINGDIGEQFFATGERDGDQQAVAVVSRARMQGWIEAIKSAGLKCNKLLPDVLAVPHEEEHWCCLGLGDTLLVRQDRWRGLQGHADWIRPAIAHHAKQQTEPLTVKTFGNSDLSNLANVDWQEETAELPMQVLAQGSQRAKFNLLQGEFKPKRQSSNRFEKWRLAAALAALALFTTLIDKGVELYQLQNQKASLQAQIEAEYKRAFPESTRIVNVRSQMRQRLAALEQGGGSASVLTIMAQLSEAFEASQVKPQTLRFDSSRTELRIMAVANNFESLEQFKRLAEGKGFEVEQGAINNRDDKVIGSLSIRS